MSAAMKHGVYDAHTYHADPCISLWRAVIVRALLDACNLSLGRGDAPKLRKRIVTDALEYFADPAFADDCTLAELDPGYVQRILAIATEKQEEGMHPRCVRDSVQDSIRRV
jgi:hypothetical protein